MFSKAMIRLTPLPEPRHSILQLNNDIINAGTVIVNGATLRFGAFQHEDRTAKNWDGKGALLPR